MKVVLDLAQLRDDGKITQAEYDKFSHFAARDTGSLAINVLIGFGVIAVAGSLLALLPTIYTTAALGAALLGTGLFISQNRAEQWRVLGTICVLIGALMLGGGLIAFDEGSLRSLLFATVIFAASGILARSGLLVAASVIALSATIGARTGYTHATYSLGIQNPTETILLFGAIALGAYHLSKRLAPEYGRLAIMAARTSVLLVNFGFWIGSLWGDRLFEKALIVPRSVFVVGWAAAIITTASWAMRANRRWVVNTAAVFGAIHFYTQWFERLGANPATVLAGGLLILVFAAAMWKFNQAMDGPKKVSR